METYNFDSNLRLQKYFSKQGLESKTTKSFRNIKKDLYNVNVNFNEKNDKTQRYFNASSFDNNKNNKNKNCLNKEHCSMLEKISSPNISLKTKDKITEILSISSQLAYDTTKKER